jgi:hypothetical protein
MLVIAGVAKAADAKVLTGTRPARKPLPKTKKVLVVTAVALVALVVLGALKTLISLELWSNSLPADG